MSTTIQPIRMRCFWFHTNKEEPRPIFHNCFCMDCHNLVLRNAVVSHNTERPTPQCGKQAVLKLCCSNLSTGKNGSFWLYTSMGAKKEKQFWYFIAIPIFPLEIHAELRIPIIYNFDISYIGLSDCSRQRMGQREVPGVSYISFRRPRHEMIEQNLEANLSCSKCAQWWTDIHTSRWSVCQTTTSANTGAMHGTIPLLTNRNLIVRAPLSRTDIRRKNNQLCKSRFSF